MFAPDLSETTQTLAAKLLSPNHIFMAVGRDLRKAYSSSGVGHKFMPCVDYSAKLNELHDAILGRGDELKDTKVIVFAADAGKARKALDTTRFANSSAGGNLLVEEMSAEIQEAALDEVNKRL